MEKIGVMLGALVVYVINHFKPAIDAYLREIEANRKYNKELDKAIKEGSEFTNEINNPNLTEAERKKALDKFLGAGQG